MNLAPDTAVTLIFIASALIAREVLLRPLIWLLRPAPWRAEAGSMREEDRIIVADGAGTVIRDCVLEDGAAETMRIVVSGECQVVIRDCYFAGGRPETIADFGGMALGLRA